MRRLNYHQPDFNLIWPTLDTVHIRILPPGTFVNARVLWETLERLGIGPSKVQRLYLCRYSGRDEDNETVPFGADKDIAIDATKENLIVELEADTVYALTPYMVSYRKGYLQALAANILGDKAEMETIAASFPLLACVEAEAPEDVQRLFYRTFSALPLF
jgi:hypothetical protein